MILERGGDTGELEKEEGRERKRGGGVTMILRFLSLGDQEEKCVADRGRKKSEQHLFEKVAVQNQV